MLRRLEPIAATDPPPDGCTPPRPRWGTSLCWRNAERSTELRNVSWLHIPKTGSTFARLIFRAACGVVPANHSHELFTEASAMHPIIALACPGAFRYFASWHTPLSQAAAEECGTHQRHCVSVVRAPAERVESGFYHAMHDCTWLQQAHGLSESGLNRTFYATFADETPKLYAHCVGGCSSRMLTGRPCGRCRPDAVSDVEGCIRRVWREAIGTDGAPYLDAILQKARRQKSCRACVADDEPADDDGSAAARVLRRFSFVGVQSAWNDTVHAFAERFGVPPLASDLVVSRPGWKPRIDHHRQNTFLPLRTVPPTDPAATTSRCHHRSVQRHGAKLPKEYVHLSAPNTVIRSLSASPSAQFRATRARETVS